MYVCMIPAASVIQVLQLPKTVLLHFRINQIYIKTLTLSKSQCNVPEMHKSNDLCTAASCSQERKWFEYMVRIYQ